MPHASTWFDLVVGVDLHYEVVPAAPAPVPFPHPFFGLVFDPVGLVVEEIISDTLAWATDTPRATGPVLINGRMATVTGDEAKMPTGHLLIPPGVSWFPMPKVPAPGGKGPSLPEPPAPPPGDAMMAFGSKTVEMRGGKAVRLGDPALSCSDPVRLPTSFVVPSGGPSNVMVGGPTVIDWVVVGLAAGFRALRTKRVSKLAHAAVERFVPKKWTRARDFLHDAACFVTGHPVNGVNGSMFTTWSDFELPGPIPLSFTRRYRSSFCDRDSVLGFGWSHSLDQRLWIEPDTIVYLTDDGRELEFDTWHLPDHVMRKGDEIFDPISRFTLRSLGGFRWEVESPGGLVRELGPVRGEAVEDRDRGMARLTRIRNRCGDAIELRYDERARLAEVIDSGGRTIRFEHDRDGRLETLWLPTAKGDGLRQHARFRYSPQGDLVQTDDAMGKPIRFEYDHHNLVKETDRNGLSFYFLYDGWGPYARCTRTWGDGRIHDHEITYDIKGRRTIVEDSLGYATVYEWGPHGTVTKIIDARGGETQFRYDGLTRRTAEIDPLGNATRYAYDERGNRTMVAGPDGTATKIRYDEHDAPVWLSTPKGAQWHWSYDRWGRRLSETNPLGQRTQYVYEQGRLVGVEDAAGVRTSLRYDRAGNVVHLVNPDGTTQGWRYDALGRVIGATDAVGNEQRRQHDALGRVVRIEEPDGNVWRLEYDGEGNVVQAHDALRHVELGYQGMGKVAWRRIAGTTVRFEYDTEERLTAFVNEAGHAYRFDRDALGNVGTEICFDGSKRKYTRDAAGRVTKVRRPGIGRFSTFEYDEAGRTTKVAHYDGSTETFAYDADGALVHANNDTIDIRFERDLLGRVVKEHQGDYWVASQYDHRGLRIGMESSPGAKQTITRNTMGGVVGMAARAGAQRWEATIERDALGLEVDRQLPGGARSYWWRDSQGRPTQHWVGREQQLSRGRRYTWGLDGRITKIFEEGRGPLGYEHDARGFVMSTCYPNGDVDLRVPDEVGNLFRTADRSDREFGPTGELRKETTPEGIRTYRYDPEGNLVQREDPDGGTWVYAWDGAGRLAKVTRPDETEVCFEYDALDRRVRKVVGDQETAWVWHGSTVLHEIRREKGSEEETTTWVFDADRGTPSARLSGTSAHSIVSDHLGAPLCALDETGATVWQNTIDVWGRTKTTGDDGLCPWRFPGQYADEETGLYYNHFRYYDPKQGQYLTTDPIGFTGGTHLRAYARDPLTSVDRLGLSARKDYGGKDPFSYYMDKANSLDVASSRNTAVFYSGRGNRELAEAFAAANGRTTLEMTRGGRWLDEEMLFGPDSPLTPDQAVEVWKTLSKRFADGASGNAVGFVQGARPRSIFNTVEYGALLANPQVTNIFTGGF